MTTQQLPSTRLSMPLHPYHMTAVSPWPVLTSSAVLALLSSAALWFNSVNHAGTLTLLGLASVIGAGSLWFKDVVTEGTHLGLHTRIVQQCLSLGVSLFIITEVMLFVSVFWAYFHSSLSPTVELGSQWPPTAIVPLSPLTMPLLNTLLLVSSGATVTYGHHAMFQSLRGAAIFGMGLTVLLAAVFTALQALEYQQAGFSFGDGAYGSAFYMSTGLHGLHVIVGTLMIVVALSRLILYHFTEGHHLGLESSILYWHFVDVVHSKLLFRYFDSRDSFSHLIN